MTTKLCIFNQTTNLIDITDGVAVYTGSPSTAYSPLILNAEGAIDSSFFSTSAPILAVAAVNLIAGQLVSLYYTSPNVYADLASALSTINLPAMGFVAADASAGSIVTINTQGVVNCPFISGFSFNNVGSAIYLSTTYPGSVQLSEPTAPDLIQPLGYIYQVGGTMNSYVQFPFVSFPLVVPATAGVANYTQPPVNLPDPNGSTSYTLGFTPTAPTASFYFVNGIKRVYNTYYVISGDTLEILDANPPNLANGDSSHELYAS